MALARLAALDRRLPFGTGTVVCATAACVFVSGWTAAFAKGTPGAARARPAATSTAAARPDSPDDYLLDVAAAMPGFKRVKDRIAGGGPMGLEDAARIEAGGTPTEGDRAALRGAGFVRGHARAWRSADGVFVVVVYEWNDAEAPRKFVRGFATVAREAGTGWTSPFPASAGICGAKDGRADDTVVAAVGKHSFLMVLTREGDCSGHAAVTDLAGRVRSHAALLGA